MVKNQSNISDRFIQKANWTGDELTKNFCCFARMLTIDIHGKYVEDALAEVREVFLHFFFTIDNKPEQITVIILSYSHGSIWKRW